MKINSLQTFICYHHMEKHKDNQRLGQRFVNMFSPENKWLDLYYADDVTAIKIISDWLMQNHYFTTFPDPIN